MPIKRTETKAVLSYFHSGLRPGNGRIEDSRGYGVLFWLFSAFMCRIDPRMLMPTGTECTVVSLYRIKKLELNPAGCKEEIKLIVNNNHKEQFYCFQLC